MRCFRFVGFWVALASLSFFTAEARAGQYSGLWVGTATLNAVSELNQRGSDLSFDLGLEGMKAENRLISRGTTWTYEATGTDLGASWQDIDYDDSTWSSGDAPFGYGYDNSNDIEVNTEVSSEQPTIYFHRDFNVTETDLSNYAGLRVQVWRDDGIVLYLNGEEILRNNISSSFVDFTSLALSETEVQDYEHTDLEITLPATLLIAGKNRLAAEVHRAESNESNESDLFFDIELAAQLKVPGTTEFIGVESEGWLYLYSDEGPGPDAKWYGTEYDDTAWYTGQARFGYGEKPELIKTELISASSQKPPAAYFRKNFSVTASDSTHLRVMLLQDDGAVVYVNGIEVFRANMPSGPISHTTAPVKALGSVDENRYLVREIKLSEIPGLVLNVGKKGKGAKTNVVAVEVHQHPGELWGAPADTTALTRTPAAFDLRFLLHVDSNDQVRLLKEVIQMYDPENEQHVLLTDHTLIPHYSGIAVRDGEPVGRRLSAPGFDFEGTSVKCSGAVSPSETVTCTVTLPSNHPTNPFLHRYHPDHDNLTARYETIEAETNYEVYIIERDIKVKFNNRYPPDEDEPERTPPPEWGTSLLGGYYEETVSGLHKKEIKVNGPFLLWRVTHTMALIE